mgnify:CR=1 FL=1
MDFKKIMRAKDLKVGMSTEFGKLEKVTLTGNWVLIETKIMQFDLRMSKNVVVYS